VPTTKRSMILAGIRLKADRRAAFKAAEILLTETGARFDLFLGQAFLPTQAGEVPADQFAHIHAQEDRDLHTLSLSTIVCK
jgi:hypothetical protein